MNQPSGAAPVTAMLSREGRIVRADEPLLRLQIEAGGEPEGTLALPPLAALVRLAMRLRMPLSRAVELARDDADISLWVELQPQGEGLHLALIDWQERRRRPSLRGAGGLRAPRAPAPVAGWSWQVDDRLHFGAIEADARTIGHKLPEPGEAFTSYFVLADAADDGSQDMPILEALARHAGFEDQKVVLRSDPACAYRLSGMALFNRDGRFSGYRGLAEPIGAARSADPAQIDAIAEPVAAPMPVVLESEARSGELFGSALGQRLDLALRRPIDRIIANADTINTRSVGPLRQDYVIYGGDIASAGRHLLALVDDIADLQAIELPGFRTAKEEVDLGELARRAAGLLHIRADARQIRVQVPGPGEQLPARAEYRRVLQILVNLVGNAVRHSPPASTIWLRLDEADGRSRVIVADQGGGIDPADHGRIFDRFERLGNTDGEGSGLGLYISRRLARAMGGDLTIDSALGSGARFVLDLPAWRQSQSDIKAG